MAATSYQIFLCWDDGWEPGCRFRPFDVTLRRADAGETGWWKSELVHTFTAKDWAEACRTHERFALAYAAKLRIASAEELAELIRKAPPHKDGDPCFCGRYVCQIHIPPKCAARLLSRLEKRKNKIPIYLHNDLAIELCRTVLEMYEERKG